MVDEERMLADFHLNRGNIQGTLDTINSWALRAIGGADAGILLMRAQGKSETVVSTSPPVREAHDLQLTFGEGPCLEVLKRGAPESFVVGDAATDRRFPTWGPAAAALGFRSVASAALDAGEKRFGSLNVYSDKPHVFALEDVAVLEVLSRRAARAIAIAEEARGLSRALDTRKLIGQAQGMLMERLNIDGDRAFEFLMRVSQERNVKLRDVASWIVERRNVGSFASPDV